MAFQTLDIPSIRTRISAAKNTGKSCGRSALSRIASALLVFASVAILVAFAPGASAASEQNSAFQLLNAGFESSLADKPGAPDEWYKAGPGTRFSLDTEIKRSGRSSLRLERNDGTAFTAVSQSLPAATVRGQVVALRAWLRAERDGSGGGSLMVVALNGERKSVAFAQSDSDGLPRVGEWQSVELRLLVPMNAESLSVGFRHTGSGALWIDDADVATWSLDQPEPLSAAAVSYLNEAISLVQKSALHAARVDWPAVTRQARALAAGAVTTGDTYAAIRHVLRQLGDGHSFLATPSQAARAKAAAEPSIAAIRWREALSQAVVSLPGFASADPGRADEYAARVREVLAEATANRCGLILDLRENSGGNLFPMMAGLAPLMANGAVGGLATADGQSTQWRFAEGSFVSSVADRADMAPSSVLPFKRIGDGIAPLAVLLGPKTASSGEAVAIALVGRANARSFGAPTAGQTTGNRGVTLADGARLAITTSVMLDRSGQRYGGKLQPDENVSPAAASAAATPDPALAAAATWLSQHPACRK